MAIQFWDLSEVFHVAHSFLYLKRHTIKQLYLPFPHTLLPSAMVADYASRLRSNGRWIKRSGPSIRHPHYPTPKVCLLAFWRACLIRVYACVFASGRRSRAIIGQPATESCTGTSGRALTNLASSDPIWKGPRPIIFCDWVDFFRSSWMK
jgi:hypothetical protein